MLQFYYIFEVLISCWDLEKLQLFHNDTHFYKKIIWIEDLGLYVHILFSNCSLSAINSFYTHYRKAECFRSKTGKLCLKHLFPSFPSFQVKSEISLWSEADDSIRIRWRKKKRLRHTHRNPRPDVLAGLAGFRDGPRHRVCLILSPMLSAPLALVWAAQECSLCGKHSSSGSPGGNSTIISCSLF